MSKKIKKLRKPRKPKKPNCEKTGWFGFGFISLKLKKSN
jgi:hypothetical protein